MNTTAVTDLPVIHAPSLDASTRHAQIFAAFDALKVGQAFELRHTHDPLPLHRQFEERSGGQFSWDYLERGPEQFRIRIARLVEAGGACCGCCGGGGH